MPKIGKFSSQGSTPEKAKVTKVCNECEASSPVACRTCTGCGADFSINSSSNLDKLESSFENDGIDGGERRRSERVKRDKPDYYDSMDFENKRKSLVTRPKRERTLTKSETKMPSSSVHRSSAAKKRKNNFNINWKKGKGNKNSNSNDEEFDKEKRKKKRSKYKEETEIDLIDELSQEKLNQCKISLAEVNRKLGVVMFQPKL